MIKDKHKKYLTQFKDTELYQRLIQIENRIPFLLYCYTLKGEDKHQKLLNYIKKYDIVSSADVFALVECIHKGEEPELVDEEDGSESHAEEYRDEASSSKYDVLEIE